jgi:hypothetical protein
MGKFGMASAAACSVVLGCAPIANHPGARAPGPDPTSSVASAAVRLCDVERRELRAELLGAGAVAELGQALAAIRGRISQEQKASLGELGTLVEEPVSAAQAQEALRLITLIFTTAIRAEGHEPGAWATSPGGASRIFQALPAPSPLFLPALTATVKLAPAPGAELWIHLLVGTGLRETRVAVTEQPEGSYHGSLYDFVQKQLSDRCQGLGTRLDRSAFDRLEAVGG